MCTVRRIEVNTSLKFINDLLEQLIDLETREEVYLNESYNAAYTLISPKLQQTTSLIEGELREIFIQASR